MKKVPTKQYNLKDELIEEFDSITSASKKTGIPIGTINTAVKYNHVTRKLYRWK